MATIEKRRPSVMRIVQLWIIVTFLVGCCGLGITLLLYLAITSFHILFDDTITTVVFIIFLFLAVPTIAVSIGQTLLLRHLQAWHSGSSIETRWTGPESTSLPLYEENSLEKRQDEIATANSNAQLSMPGIWLRWIVVTVLTGCISATNILGLSKSPLFTYQTLLVLPLILHSYWVDRSSGWPCFPWLLTRP